jgi:hypothetical protein
MSGALWWRHLSSYKDPPLPSILKLAAVVFETINMYRHLKKQEL